MSAPHLHLVFNHFPVVGVFFALLLFAWAVYRRSDEMKKTVIGAVLLLTLLTVPVYLTGEEAAEEVKQFPDVAASHVDTHEAAGELAFTAMFVMGLYAAACLWLFRRTKPAAWSLWVLLVMLVVCAALMARAANLGGQIRHPEIRATSSADSLPRGGGTGVTRCSFPSAGRSRRGCGRRRGCQSGRRGASICGP